MRRSEVEAVIIQLLTGATYKGNEKRKKEDIILVCSAKSGVVDRSLLSRGPGAADR